MRTEVEIRRGHIHRAVLNSVACSYCSPFAQNQMISAGGSWVHEALSFAAVVDRLVPRSVSGNAEPHEESSAPVGGAQEVHRADRTVVVTSTMTALTGLLQPPNAVVAAAAGGTPPPETAGCLNFDDDDDDLTCMPRTILLYGPPGTGKTAVVRHCCQQARRALICVTPSDLLSQWVGGTEKRLRQLFHVAQMAAPSVLFIDEIDALFSSRGGNGESEVMRRVKTEALLLLQDVLDFDGGAAAARSAFPPPPVVVIGATNLPWELDAAVLRRFEERLLVPCPSADERWQLVRGLCPLLRRHHGDADEPDAFAAVAAAFDGCSCAEVSAICRATRRRHTLAKAHRRIATTVPDVVRSSAQSEASAFRALLISTAATYPRVTSPRSAARCDAWGTHAKPIVTS